MSNILKSDIINYTKTVLKEEVKKHNLIGFDVDSIEIKFTLRGVTAGTYTFSRTTLAPISINYQLGIAEVNGFEKFKETIIHECAHAIANFKYKRNVGHNTTWKYICHSMGGNPTRCHNHELPEEVIRKNHVEDYKYKCKCKVHLLSAIRHKRASRNDGGMYRCTICKTPLVFIG